MIGWLRRGWTIAVVGVHTGRRYSLESMYRFRRQQDAIARAADLNRRRPGEITRFEAQQR